MAEQFLYERLDATDAADAGSASRRLPQWKSHDLYRHPPFPALINHKVTKAQSFIIAEPACDAYGLSTESKQYH